MQVRLSLKAYADLDSLDWGLGEMFYSHFDKVAVMPPRRHLRHGIPFFVENVTGQARFAYRFEPDHLLIVRCFATHKEYEAWLKSFK